MEVPVLLPKIFNHPFTYKNETIKNLNQGDFVLVQFGKKKEIGIVWDKIESINKNIKLKRIEKKLPNLKINKKLIKFINWFSKYNLAPKGLILKMCLANQKKFENKKQIKEKFENFENTNFDLSPEQKRAVNELNNENNKFNVKVLLGVTGSGKTLVYFEKIKKILKEKKQVLILLPEIFLTSQFKKRFKNFFGFEPFLWHSKITKKNKRLIWNSIHKNNIKIIIGARSALFLPFKKLGLIIVDEEHDPSYKQEDQVIYNARDMAISRASIENIPICLVTSVPSLETYHNIEIGKYKKVTLSKRFKNYPFPKTKVINIKLDNLKNNSISLETISVVREYLKKGNQILFFLNRRGYSPFLICKKCGYKYICPNCSIYLTYHKILKKVVCHHCGFKSDLNKKCNLENLKCDFSMYGPGVERVYDEVKNIFNDKKIKIFSSDYLESKNTEDDMIDLIERHNVDIIVGTQMISKGFNFPKLNCIVVVDADFTGKGFDLRTTEKNIQLYNQLSGRAVRFSSESIIIYQTINPEHQTLKDVIINNPEKFLINELVLRKENNLPPFKRLIAIIISATSRENSFRAAQEVKKRLNINKNLEILGPVDSPIFKRKNKFRTRLLIRCKGKVIGQNIVSKTLKKLKISQKIKLTVDVDPINFT